ncbi:2OG-Fe(II) oxygenase [Streptomyces sp. CJ_13]|uniref:2OG-Fe(II) oxygenase n=1 Tax=Streptomyces sp. CJ_13 TaxID=2724943 RepID=UPI001BDCFF16|nr:2OG-Fe(II) oxygenase [Streptomyces sp. CJ_13]MBT1185148.1 2OG-Fe(II) oxygenase [Streptomyces sp. CJ_13]
MTRHVRPAVTVTDPYPHATVEEFLGEATADRVLRWLERDALWLAERSPLYEQYRCGNLLDLLFSEDVGMGTLLLRIAEQTEQVFGRAIERRRIEAGAHKHGAGHYVRTHTDVPHGLTETHRVVITLASSAAPVTGGELVLQGSEPSSGNDVVIPHRHGRAVFMELSRRSYHSVLPVQGGARYSLVLSYWAASTSSCEPWQRPSPESVPTGLLQVLERLGAHEVPHASRHAERSGRGARTRPLSDHLLGTYRVLRDWGCNPDVCAAGLFHGLYGPRGAGTALLSLKHRDTLREAIGTRAEELVYLYSALDRSSDHLRRGGLLRARLLGGEKLIDMEAGIAATVFLLTWASLREQASEVVLSSGEIEELLARLELFGAFVPESAARDLRATFAP